MEANDGVESLAMYLFLESLCLNRRSLERGDSSRIEGIDGEPVSSIRVETIDLHGVGPAHLELIEQGIRRDSVANDVTLGAGGWRPSDQGGTS